MVTPKFTEASQILENLENREVQVNPKHIGDFIDIYGTQGFSSTDKITITSDNFNVRAPGSDTRIVNFKNQNGAEGYGCASRFVVPVNGA